MNENFVYFTIKVREVRKKMREVQREERTDFLFYFNGFALWIRMNK